MYHPWRRLRELTHIDLFWIPLPTRLGATDGTSAMVLDPRQSQAERRSTVAHEVAHIEDPSATEAQVKQIAARRLIPLEDLLDALRWTEELEEVAEILWVDLQTLTDRFDGLTAAEKRAIVELAKEMGDVR